MDPTADASRWVLAGAVVVLALAGRGFLATWKRESRWIWLWRLFLGLLCLAAFLVAAFFQVRL